jgi:hypothetical protein
MDVDILLIGSRGRGYDYWITKETYLIENLLEFNGLPYEFFDIGTDVLTQAILDEHRAVIVEGYALRWDADFTEFDLIAQNIEDGSISVLLTVVHGQFATLNGTVYAAMDVAVDGIANEEGHITLSGDAAVIYDYPADEGFVFTSGPGPDHVGVAVTSLGRCTFVGDAYCADRVCMTEAALGSWMEIAFGVDARATLPIISLGVYDTQTTPYPRDQQVIDFVDANKHRIRASGYLVTSRSAYHGTDSTLMSDEEILSRWGSMSLHGYDHGSVGAEGEDRDFATQFAAMSEARDFLEEHFARYKPIKGPPNNSWNEETLHAMALLDIPYLCSTIRRGIDYKNLYKSVLDAADEWEREKMFARGDYAGLRYYPLYHSDVTGEARIYTVDWYVAFGAMDDPEVMPSMMRQYCLDWWTPTLAATHFCLPDSNGAQNNPEGWMAITGALMDLVDHEDHPYRRWVDSHDYALNVQRFDTGLTVDRISISGNLITYEITAAEPVRYLTLKASAEGRKVESVSIDGTDYCYFGDDYVHLPEVMGAMTVAVTMTTGETCCPHVWHVDPCAVIETAEIAGDILSVGLSGEFEADVRVAGLAPEAPYLVSYDGGPPDTCCSCCDGGMCLCCGLGSGLTTVEIARDTTRAGGIAPPDGGPGGFPPLYLCVGPNPVMGSGSVRFGLPARSRVRLAVYSVDGRLVSVLADSERPPGHHAITWNGAGPRGRALPPGLYFCRLDAGRQAVTRKILLLK